MQTSGRSRRHCKSLFRLIARILLTVSRQKAKKAHPDVGGSEEQMAALNEAYEVLSDSGEFQSLCLRIAADDRTTTTIR